VPAVDTALLFPPLDRGEGVPEVPAHQALLHDVLWDLQRECSVPSLFTDERWNVVRSSIPWQCWQHVLRQHGLPCSLEVWTGRERSTAPILDLLLLGSCQEIAPKTMLDLVTVLAPYLRSSREGGVEVRDSGPLGGETVRLLLPADSFEFADCTMARKGRRTGRTLPPQGTAWFT
jgi:hypothetical protein